MLTLMKVKNFKSIRDASLELQPITVFIGPNSSGKSTALLAILLSAYERLPQEVRDYVGQRQLPLLPFDEPESSACRIDVFSPEGNKASAWSQGQDVFAEASPEWTTTIHFLCANRAGPLDAYPAFSGQPFDIFGTRAFAYFEEHKNKPVEAGLLHPDAEMETLGGQVNYWLQHILETKLATAKRENNPNQVEARYSHAGEARLSPLQTGFGTSTLVPVLIMALAAKKGETLLIENPEMHLHPRAQARLADFFAFVAHAGIQCILETHCEHLLYKLCHNVHCKAIANEKLIFYYKKSSQASFECIKVDREGRFTDVKGDVMGFPGGFFDATLQEYLSIYR